MLKNYIKIAFRNLFKNRVFTFINVAGLAIGISCCFLILAHVQDELSYDRFHKNAKNIYRIALERLYPTHHTFYAIIPHSFAEVVREDYPEVVDAVRLFTNQNTTVFRYEDEKGTVHIHEEKQFMLADSNFFKMFTVPLLKGNIESALDGPDKIVVTESIAKKYFGDIDPIGKVITANQVDYKVSAVCKDLPENSHFDFDLLAGLGSIPFFKTLNFTGFSAYTYLMLDEKADASFVESKLPETVLKYAAPQIEQSMNISYEQYQAQGHGYRYFLQNLADIHLHSNLEAEMKVNGSINQVYIFISISVFILLLACINFMNLATARSAERAKEVGVRKVMGSLKQQLIAQFLTESIVISCISLVLALVIISFALPYFNDLAGKQIELNFINIEIILGLIAFSIFVGIVSGIYPAFFITSFSIVNVMKGQFKSSNKGIWLRNGLVIFQFFISIVLIAGTLVVYRQMQYMKQTDLGYQKEEIIVLEGAGALGDKTETFKNELNKISGIMSAAVSSSMPGKPFFFGSSFRPEGKDEAFVTKVLVMDEDYQETLGLKLVEGRGFVKAFNDSTSIILNESAVKALGIVDPIGTKLTITNNNQGDNIQYTVVGIVSDFHFQSLRDEISPLAIIYPRNNNFGFMAVRIENNAQSQEAITAIESLWKEFQPEIPFKYTFFEEDLDAQYIADDRFGSVFFVFAILAIMIACIGLFGLAAYTASLKTKEIGVRKVLGASVLKIIFMLTGKFSILVIVAFVCAIPVIYYIMEMWLSSFAYRTSIGLMPFLLSGIIAFSIAWLTVSYQSIKAAIINPVKSLKSE